MTRANRVTKLFETMSDRAAWVLLAAVLITALLAIPFVGMQPTENASQEPSGEVFDARDRIEERFIPRMLATPVILEATGGSMLDKPALLDLLAAGERVRNEATLAGTLLSIYEAESGTDIDGVHTIAELIDRDLPQGIAGSDQQDIDRVANALIDRLGVDSQTIALSVESTFDGSADRWNVPAITAFVLSDNDVLGFPTGGVALGTETEPEEYKRTIVETMASETGAYDAWGIAIDVNLTSAEQGEAAGPFIGLTILAILVIVGITFRSYWVMAIAGASLSAMIVWLYGITNLIGLKNDLILSLIVPIAMISFGIDFAFHAVGRYREQRATGMAPHAAFVGGMAAVIGALTLALTSDAVAFLSNTVSGIESIVQFGAGTAIALGVAYLLLGVVTPLAVSVIDSRLGERPVGLRHGLVRWTGAAIAGIFSMTVALLLVFLSPAAGVVALFAYVAFAIVVPALLARNHGLAFIARNRAGRVGRVLSTAIVAITRRWKAVVAVSIVVLAGSTILAVQVPTEFDVKDFFAEDTAFVVGLDKVEQHVGELGGEPALVSIEADLTDPMVVAAIANFEEELKRSDTPTLARNSDGVITGGGVGALLRDFWTSPVAADIVAERTGVNVTDGNNDGVPDTSDQLRALFATVRTVGVPLDATRSLRTPDTVATDIWVEGPPASSATIISIAVRDTARQESIVETRQALAPILDELEQELQSLDADASVVLTGGPIVRQTSLEAVSRALAMSLPISVLLCVLIASVFMRSIRLGLVSIMPILITVATLYAFMFVAGFSINIVTATIGAVSIGIGIDFAIHYTMRYREELALFGNRLEAVRTASEGTGAALLASAASSVVGFGILAFAPMPLFASYGLLTAVMIGMAAVATLVVLPSLLVMVTTDRVDANEPIGERELVTV